MDINKVKDTIRKLLNTAGNEAASEGEIENAVKSARNLMHAYNVE